MKSRAVRQLAAESGFSKWGRKSATLIAAPLLFAIAGCGGKSETPKSTSVAPTTTKSSSDVAKSESVKSEPQKSAADKTNPQTAATAVAAPAGIGTLKGRIILEGTPPAFKLLVTKGQDGVRDAAVCATHDIPDESLVVGDGGGVANVFVYLGSAPKGTKAPPATEPLVFDQKGCQYVPHAMLVRTHQPVLVKSDDPVAHNVHTAPTRNAPFNQLIKANDRDGLKLMYNDPEREPVVVKCDIHGWMLAYQLPLDHQFAALTDSAGRFEIKDLPAGNHEFRIWHERPKFLERKYQVEIKPNETTDVEIKFPTAKFASTSNAQLKAVTLSMKH